MCADTSDQCSVTALLVVTGIKTLAGIFIWLFFERGSCYEVHTGLELMVIFLPQLMCAEIINSCHHTLLDLLFSHLGEWTGLQEDALDLCWLLLTLAGAALAQSCFHYRG